jgi:cytochrome c-type biogenesis protein CcmH/NrfF
MKRLVLIFLTLALAVPAAAGAAEPRTNLPDIEDEVMCPVCGTPLNLAQAPQADRERVFIQRLIDQGLTKEQIKDRLVAEYGEQVIAEPDDEGFDAAAWLVPIVVVLGALLALALVVPRWRRGRAGGDPAAEDTEDEQQPIAADDARRLDDELARFDG